MPRDPPHEAWRAYAIFCHTFLLCCTTFNSVSLCSPQMRTFNAILVLTRIRLETIGGRRNYSKLFPNVVIAPWDPHPADFWVGENGILIRSS